MRPSVDTVRTVCSPGAGLTLLQSAILVPVALAVADVIDAGIDRIAQLFRRG